MIQYHKALKNFDDIFREITERVPSVLRITMNGGEFIYETERELSQDDIDFLLSYRTSTIDIYKPLPPPKDTPPWKPIPQPPQD